ncbi:MAG: DUF4159 domain-containing protein [Alphaproteobacteria bacterium]|nr:DUF4159 domain-containing protein [Alphaproteobacteria bacterium]
MFALGPLSFATPLALLGLLALPALWYLLRATPPAPKRAIFPPLRLLLNAPDDNETPHHAPWWLILFRLLIAALIIIALAQPVWTPPSVVDEERPGLIIVDNGWRAASSWPQTERRIERQLAEIERDGRLVAIAFTASTGQAPANIVMGDADEARRQLDNAAPQPWSGDRGNLAERLSAASLLENLAVTWYSNGVESDGARELARVLNGFGGSRIIEPEAGFAPLALYAPEVTTEGLTVAVTRAPQDLPLETAVTALGADGRALARAELSFDGGEGRTNASIALPLDLRNRITSLRIEGQQSAGAVRLLGDRWRRPRVGLIEANSDEGQPLLADLHYVESAIAPFSVTERGDLASLVEAEPAVLIMVDDARSDDQSVDDFVNQGGLLLRFAGPRLAARGDDLLPVELREGGRLFGGALNWDEPQRMAAFSAQSPFAGLPSDGAATIQRQVLAAPASATPDRVWARLEDGTPLVTAQRRGRGWIVLFHVTAGPTWSDLPLSGLFPRMLERVLGLAQNGEASGPAAGAWVIDRSLDAEGRLSEAPATARPIPVEQFDRLEPSPIAPPGLYRLGAASNALNTVTPDTRMDALSRDLPGAIYQSAEGPRALHFQAGLLVAAMVMLILDVLIALGLAGRLGAPALAALMLFAILPALPGQPQAFAQDDTERLLNSALDLRFAYAMSGDSQLDERSRAGLTGLGREVMRRSAIEPSSPMGVNIETDEILFFPMIYWPVSRDAPPLSEAAAARVTAYLQGGGLIIFDTQDADIAMLRAGAPHPGLVNVLESIDVPALARIPSDHVLTRSFYLLDTFPGRFADAPVWVEANPDGASRDGTSGVVIGSNDWASAWAVDENGRPLATVDGGERQRELATRFGVNMAMYALTGNYKADQVHIPDILERLGQ